MNISEERAVTGPILVGMAQTIDESWDISCAEATQLASQLLKGMKIEKIFQLVLHLNADDRRGLPHEIGCFALDAKMVESVVSAVKKLLPPVHPNSPASQ